MKKDNKIGIFFGVTLGLFVIIVVLLRVYNARLDANAAIQNQNEIVAEENAFAPATASYPDYADVPAAQVKPEPNQVVAFTKTFFVPTSSSPVELAIAADNGYSVSVNGQFVGSSSPEDTNFVMPTNYDLTSALHEGEQNTLSITVTNLWDGNGYAWNENPAGLLYEVTNNGSILTASDGSEIASTSNATDAAIVIPQSALAGSWANLEGAQWIWDKGLYELESSSSVNNAGIY